MPDDQELDLQDDSTWDSDKAEVRQPSRSNRVVVSVAFTRQDFEKVVEHAESVNMKTSEFIRSSALEKVSKPAETSDIITYSVSNAGLLISGTGIGGTTHKSSSAFREEEAITA